MGVNYLWKFLKENDCVEVVTGLSVLRLLEGQRVAIDMSVWIVEGYTENHLHSLTHSSRGGGGGDTGWRHPHLKVIFERLIHYLRAGIIPVAVFEGQMSNAKAKAKGNISAALSSVPSRESSPSHSRFPSSVLSLAKEVVESLGLFHLTASHGIEGEGLCAALNAPGAFVDAVVSNDGDALLYGAEVVFKDLRIHTANVSECYVEVCRMARITEKLFLGRDELIALSLFVGNDYVLNGVEGVGMKKALSFLRTLSSRSLSSSASSSSTTGSEGALTSMSPVLRALQELLSLPINPTLLSLKGCNTCKRCGHGRTLRKEHTKGCKECQRIQQSLSTAIPSSSLCIPRPANSRCPCDFHQKEEDILVARMAQKMQTQMSKKEFEERCQEAIQVFYLSLPSREKIQDDLSAFLASVRPLASSVDGLRRREITERSSRKEDEEQEESHEISVEWICRPDVERLSRAMSSIYNAEAIRKKVLPLLLEWDVRQLHKYPSSSPSPSPSSFLSPSPKTSFLTLSSTSSSARLTDERSYETHQLALALWAREQGLEFIPTAIQKESTRGRRKLTFEDQEVDEDNAERQTERESKGGNEAEPWRFVLQWKYISPLLLEEREKINSRQGSHDASNESSSLLLTFTSPLDAPAEARSVRLSVLRRNCRHLLDHFHSEKARKEGHKEVGKKGGQKRKRKEEVGGEPLPSTRIDSFFRVVKPSVNGLLAASSLLKPSLPRHFSSLQNFSAPLSAPTLRDLRKRNLLEEATDSESELALCSKSFLISREQKEDKEEHVSEEEEAKEVGLNPRKAQKSAREAGSAPLKDSQALLHEVIEISPEKEEKENFIDLIESQEEEEEEEEKSTTTTALSPRTSPSQWTTAFSQQREGEHHGKRAEKKQKEGEMSKRQPSNVKKRPTMASITSFFSAPSSS